MSRNAPGRTYDNPLTRAIESRSALRTGAAITGEPLPSSRSAALGRVIEETPLSPEERAERDAKAMELGIMPRPEGEEGPYGSLEQAAAAGAPIERTLTVNGMLTEQARVPSVPVTARQVIAATGGFPRLPDFSKVGGIDLIRDVVYVDGMEFPLSKEHADEFRVYCIQRAIESVNERMQAALAPLLKQPEVATSGHTHEDVQRVQGGEAAQ